MIAKDEEAWIGQCIKSVAPIVSEIILVDTGSSDKTLSIAEHLGARVLTHPWDDDFSTPRNLSIEAASSAWILVLDADEAIAEGDLAGLRELTLDRTRCYEFTQRHYSDDVRISAFTPVSGQYPEWERHYGGYFESKLCRLFPNHEGINYQGRVHELVEHRIRELRKHQIIYSPIPIHHYGHTAEVKSKKNKGTLYTPLGTQKLSDEPQSWKAWFELGVEHNNGGRLEESAAALTRAIELNPHYVDSWTNLGYVQCELGRYPEAIKSLQTAVQIEPTSHEGYCNLGVTHLRLSQFELAEKCFRIAIKIFPKYVNAYCNLGKALAMQKRRAEAAQIYLRALDLFPQSLTARFDLGVLYFQQGLFADAQGYIESALKDHPRESQAYYLLAQVLRQLNKREDAAKALTAFIDLAQLQPQRPEVIKQLEQAQRELQTLRA